MLDELGREVFFCGWGLILLERGSGSGQAPIAGERIGADFFIFWDVILSGQNKVLPLQHNSAFGDFSRST